MAVFGVNDLVLTADLAFTHTIAPPTDKTWAGYTPRLQVRHPYDYNLLIELTALLSVDGTDLILTVPADLSGKLPTEGVWDVLAEGAESFRTPRGRLLVLKGVTTPLF